MNARHRTLNKRLGRRHYDRRVLSVSEIWRYPIKSVGGERVAVATVNDLGIIGDRGWGIFDVDTETVLTARRSPDLLFANAHLDGEGVTIELPDGTKTTDTESGCNGVLSEWLGRRVELRPAGAEGGTYEVPLDFENDENWVSWQGPGGAWHDSTKSRVLAREPRHARRLGSASVPRQSDPGGQRRR